MNPGGGDRVDGLGGGTNPTMVGGGPGRDLVGWTSSSGPALMSLFSFTFCSSSFSGRSSLRRRGRGSLVRPRTIRLDIPWERSSSVLMESCLKEKEEAGRGAADGEDSSLFSGGFLTTRRITFTTFLGVSPRSSPPSASGRLPSAAAPFCSALFLLIGSGSGLWISPAPFANGSGLRISPAPFASGSGLLNRSGTFTGDLILGGEGLRTRTAAAASVGDTGRGLLARNIPRPASNAGTDLAWLDSPLLSGCSERIKGKPKKTLLVGTPLKELESHLEAGKL